MMWYDRAGARKRSENKNCRCLVVFVDLHNSSINCYMKVVPIGTVQLHSSDQTAMFQDLKEPLNRIWKRPAELALHIQKSKFHRTMTDDFVQRLTS